MASELEEHPFRLKQGDHVCLIYEKFAQQMATAVPFIKEGLARREHCVYIADDRSGAEVARAFAEGGIDVTGESRRGALRILTKLDTYLLSGTFTPMGMIDFIRHAESEALAKGFAGRRIAGEMSWALGPELGCDLLIEYEALINRFLANTRSVVLCQYNRSLFNAPCIHDVLRTHPVAIVGDQACANHFYEPPEMVLDIQPQASTAFLAKRVDWWIIQLMRGQSVEREKGRLVDRLQALSHRLLEMQEEERRHLARELHDEIGQMLTSLRLVLRPNDSLQPDIIKARVEQALSIIDDLLQRIQGMSFDLRPAALDQFGLLPALISLFERYSALTKIKVDFEHGGVEGRFPPEMEIAVYRIAQEALTNIARHAKVARATVRLWVASDRLYLQIEDRGQGFVPDAVLAISHSSGLAGMQERITLLNGQLTIESQPGTGTRITAELPFRHPGEDETR